MSEAIPSETVNQSPCTEVSRSHSSEEALVTGVERRAESSKLMFFFKVK